MEPHLVESSSRAVERRQQPLRNAVRVALRRYFAQLEGHEPSYLYRMVMEEIERPLLEVVMGYCQDNQTRAARILGLSRNTLRERLRHYGLLNSNLLNNGLVSGGRKPPS